MTGLIKIMFFLLMLPFMVSVQAQIIICSGVDIAHKPVRILLEPSVGTMHINDEIHLIKPITDWHREDTVATEDYTSERGSVIYSKVDILHTKAPFHTVLYQINSVTGDIWRVTSLTCRTVQ